MHSIRHLAFFERLKDSRRVLVAGAGGGFDIYAGLPLALALLAEGKQVHLANLSFTYLGGTSARFIAPHLAAITPDVEGENGYFPERTLARWLQSQDLPSTVFAFEKVGVRPMRAAYRALCDELAVDAIVLVDGGTDILMFGDEAGLGTPQEDMTSLAAVSKLDVSIRLVACIGFGIDAYHGVCHAHFLENVATLARDHAYLGAFSVAQDSIEGAAFLDAVTSANTVTLGRPSIVNGSIGAAMRGEFGNAQFTTRTQMTELFINPLMSIYFGFDLMGVAHRSLYLDRLEHTETIFEVSAAIEAFRHEVRARPRRSLPH
jgi:hypothetical protein